jgi:hypothetical protein
MNLATLRNVYLVVPTLVLSAVLMIPMTVGEVHGDAEVQRIVDVVVDVVVVVDVAVMSLNHLSPLMSPLLGHRHADVNVIVPTVLIDLGLLMKTLTSTRSPLR